MDYGELKTYFKEILNRNDCTDTQADLFISLGLRRTERVLRTNLQKTNFTLTVDVTYPGYIAIPNDYLALHYMKVNGLAIRRMTDVNAPIVGEGSADEFFLSGGKIYFRPTINETDTIDLCYYSEFTEATGDGSLTRFSVVIPDVIIYAALGYAADFYTDVRKADFANTFATLAAEVQLFSDQDDLTGMAVQNPYAGMC